MRIVTTSASYIRQQRGDEHKNKKTRFIWHEPHKDAELSMHIPVSQQPFLHAVLAPLIKSEG